MSENLIVLIAFLSPAIFSATAIASWFQPGFRPKLITGMSIASAIMNMFVVALCGYYVFEFGLLESGLLGIKDIGLSLRLDSLNVLMLGMISLLGFVIIKFSINYMDGDAKQGAFLGRIAATIASVQLLVISGNLGILLISWILTSMTLHRLLVFYHERQGAQIAARKKFILARLGDICLFISFGLLYSHYGSGNLEIIFNAIKSAPPIGFQFSGLEVSALFLVLAAMLKSAQFPTHGWLIEVVETPTPVSAMLHAGLLNAGPFLMLRMAYVLEESAIAPVLLITIGGLTALFASVSYMTQTSVKTALGYSSIGHMGFSLMVCGLGVYSAAMLHLVAHSFYKAHSFLSSGSTIDLLKAGKVKNGKQSVSIGKIALGIAMALGLYSVFAMIWGVDLKNEVSLLFIGAVIVLGLSRLFTLAIASSWSSKLLTQSALLSLLVTVAFFTLESGTHYLLSSQVPELSIPGWGKFIAAAFILLLFSMAVFIQMAAPQLSQKPSYLALGVHVRNGFYANAIFDRLVNAWSMPKERGREVYNPWVSVDTENENTLVKELRKHMA